MTTKLDTIKRFIKKPKTVMQVATKVGLSRVRAWEILRTTPGIVVADTVQGPAGRPSYRYTTAS